MPSRKAGQGLAEYVVLLALASLIGLAVVSVAGAQLSDAFNRVTAAVANPMELLTSPTATPSPSFSPIPPADAPQAATPAPAASATPTAAPTVAPAATPAPHPAPTPDGDPHHHHDD